MRARTGGTKCSLSPSIHPPLLPALKTSHHREQLPSLLSFFLLLMKSSQSLSQLCLSVSARRGEKGVSLERKRDSMCLSEWRWRVSVWLVNPV